MYLTLNAIKQNDHVPVEHFKIRSIGSYNILAHEVNIVNYRKQHSTCFT